MRVNLLMSQGRMAIPKVRAFLDFAVPRLRAAFARLSAGAPERSEQDWSASFRSPEDCLPNDEHPALPSKTPR